MSFRRQHRQAGTTVETSSRWAWPPMERGGTAGSVGAAKGPRGGSLSALDLLDRAADEPDVGWPQTEAELATFYHSSIMDQQQRHLEPLREDLADWLNKILGEFNQPTHPRFIPICSRLFPNFISFRFFLFFLKPPLSFVTYVHTFRYAPAWLESSWKLTVVEHIKDPKIGILFAC